MIQNSGSDLGSVLTDKTRVDLAIRQARDQAIQQHQQAHQPMIVWRDGAVMWIHPEALTEITGQMPERSLTDTI